MSLYERVRELPLVVEGYELGGHAYVISPDFTRKTTEIRLVGAGEEGLGEDVTYDAAEHDAQQARGPVLELAGEWTLDGFSRHLDAQRASLNEPSQFPERGTIRSHPHDRTAGLSGSLAIRDRDHAAAGS